MAGEQEATNDVPARLPPMEGRLASKGIGRKFRGFGGYKAPHTASLAVRPNRRDHVFDRSLLESPKGKKRFIRRRSVEEINPALYAKPGIVDHNEELSIYCGTNKHSSPPYLAATKFVPTRRGVHVRPMNSEAKNIRPFHLRIKQDRYFWSPDPGPKITQIHPNNGHLQGSTRVSVIGSGFQPTATRGKRDRDQVRAFFQRRGPVDEHIVASDVMVLSDKVILILSPPATICAPYDIVVSVGGRRTIPSKNSVFLYRMEETKDVHFVGNIDGVFDWDGEKPDWLLELEARRGKGQSTIDGHPGAHGPLRGGTLLLIDGDFATGDALRNLNFKFGAQISKIVKATIPGKQVCVVSPPSPVEGIMDVHMVIVNPKGENIVSKESSCTFEYIRMAGDGYWNGKRYIFDDDDGENTNVNDDNGSGIEELTFKQIKVDENNAGIAIDIKDLFRRYKKSPKEMIEEEEATLEVLRKHYYLIKNIFLLYALDVGTTQTFTQVSLTSRQFRTLCEDARLFGKNQIGVKLPLPVLDITFIRCNRVYGEGLEEQAFQDAVDDDENTLSFGETTHAFVRIAAQKFPEEPRMSVRVLRLIEEHLAPHCRTLEDQQPFLTQLTKPEAWDKFLEHKDAISTVFNVYGGLDLGSSAATMDFQEADRVIQKWNIHDNITSYELQRHFHLSNIGIWAKMPVKHDEGACQCWGLCTCEKSKELFRIPKVNTQVEPNSEPESSRKQLKTSKPPKKITTQVEAEEEKQPLFADGEAEDDLKLGVEEFVEFGIRCILNISGQTTKETFHEISEDAVNLAVDEFISHVKCDMRSLQLLKGPSSSKLKSRLVKLGSSIFDKVSGSRSSSRKDIRTPGGINSTPGTRPGSIDGQQHPKGPTKNGDGKYQLAPP